MNKVLRAATLGCAIVVLVLSVAAIGTLNGRSRAEDGFSPLTATESQLLADDLPPRPSAPGPQLDGWELAMAEPTRLVPADLTAGSVTHGIISDTSNWEGYGINGNYTSVSGMWVVARHGHGTTLR